MIHLHYWARPQSVADCGRAVHGRRSWRPAARPDGAWCMRRTGDEATRMWRGRMTRTGMQLGVAAALTAGGIGALATSAWAQTSPCTQACQEVPNVPPTEATTPPTEPTTPRPEPTTASTQPTTAPVQPTTAAPVTTVVVRPV